MSQSLLEMTKELVEEHIHTKQVQTVDIQSLLQSTYATLQRLHQNEAARVAPDEPSALEGDTPADWKRSIARHAITCLECGDTFRQLSARHLRTHDLDPRSYRLKYGIPRSQPLSSREATARRREVAKQVRPWEGATAKRAAGQATTKKSRGQP